MVPLNVGPDTKKSRGVIFVCYGTAIPFEKAKDMDEGELAEFLTDTLRQLQNDCRARQGKERIQY